MFSTHSETVKRVACALYIIYVEIIQLAADIQQLLSLHHQTKNMMLDILMV